MYNSRTRIVVLSVTNSISILRTGVRREKVRRSLLIRTRFAHTSRLAGCRLQAAALSMLLLRKRRWRWRWRSRATSLLRCWRPRLAILTIARFVVEFILPVLLNNFYISYPIAHKQLAFESQCSPQPQLQFKCICCDHAICL